MIPALAHILSTTVLPALCGYKLLAKEGRAYAGNARRGPFICAIDWRVQRLILDQRNNNERSDSIPASSVVNLDAVAPCVPS